MSLEEKKPEENLDFLIAQEKDQARKRFSKLFEIVKKRYENLPSEEMRKEYMAHIEDVLDGVIEISFLKNFDFEERLAVEMAAVLHDIAKADKAPEKMTDIPNYVLANHHRMAADEIPSILSDDYLKKVGIKEEKFDKLRNQVKKAILEHMGPHPGFMGKILESVNKKLKTENFPEIVHPRAEGKISQALLAADMRSLASSKGIRKILAIRSSGDIFLAEDEKRRENFQNAGKYLSLAEIRFLSAMESALEAVRMVEGLNDPDLAIWIESVISRSKKDLFKDPVSGEELGWENILKKIE